MNKEFRTWLILDYKIGNFRCTKKLPHSLKATDIPIDLKLNVKIPEKPILKAKGEIELSETKATEIVVSQIEG